jgi:DNA adenine methylase
MDYSRYPANKDYAFAEFERAGVAPGFADAAPKQKRLLSPFRYPGGKSWLRPFIQQWLAGGVDHLVEAFAGGGSVTLMSVSEGLAKRATMIELDEEVAAVWDAALNGQAEWLCQQLKSFKVQRKTVLEQLGRRPRSTRRRAWLTLLRNRMNHGGILAPGAGLLKRGEDDNGLKSRWYPDTLAARIRSINKLKDRISFISGDGLEWLEKQADELNKQSSATFIDPPYPNVGRRLYACGTIDHRRLFQVAERLKNRVLLTYNDSSEIRALAAEYGFSFRAVKMLTRQNLTKTELLLAKNFDWLTDQDER